LACEINIEDPTVSRRHCQVYLEGDGPVFRDLGSRNVSLVNGTVVTECRLALGDELAIGASVFILTRTATPNPTPIPPELDSSPSTVSLNRVLFGDAETANDNEASYPATAHDVLRMFQFSRLLSRATCQEAFASICVRELEERFSKEATVAVWCGTHEDLQCYPASYTPPDEILEQVMASVRDGRPTLARHRKKGRLFQDQVLACVAPLMVSGLCFGVFLVTAPARRYVLNDSDLGRLHAMAQAAAQYQVWPAGALSRHRSTGDHPVENVARPPAVDSDDERIAAIIHDTQLSIDDASRRTASNYDDKQPLNASTKSLDRYHDPSMDALENAEKTLVRAVLSQCGGDVAQAAKVFGTSPAALQPLIDELGISGKP